MECSLATPDVEDLPAVLVALASWQRAGEALQLHPGDVAWHQRLGAARTADAVRTWSADGRIVAVALIDDGIPRLTTEPGLRQDAALATAMADDLARPERGVLPAGPASVEIPSGALLERVLADAGWRQGEPWVPLERDLDDEVALPAGTDALRIVTVDGTDPAAVEAWALVQRSAFGTERATAERWYAMAAGAWAEHSRTLLGYAGEAPAAGIIAWAAGPGRPGLIEPMGVHAEHRGRGYARVITLAAAAALRELGASSAQVCTEGDRAGAIATYRSAGFAPLPTRYDRDRAA